MEVEVEGGMRRFTNDDELWKGVDSMEGVGGEVGGEEGERKGEGEGGEGESNLLMKYKDHREFPYLPGRSDRE